MNSIKSLILLLPFLLSGCSLNNTHKSNANYYFLNQNRNLSAVGRAILVQLGNDSTYPQISSDVTDAIYEAAQKKQVFGLTVVRENDPRWRNLQLDKFADYSLEQLSAMHKSLRSNAVLRGTITRYEPFPHLIIGLRLELIDLTDGQLLWALEQIWDAADKNTQDRVNDYYNQSFLPGSKSLEVGLGTVSSLKFIKFVAYEIAETLQSPK